MKVLMGREKGVEQDRWESMLWNNPRPGQAQTLKHSMFFLSKKKQKWARLVGAVVAAAKCSREREVFQGECKTFSPLEYSVTTVWALYIYINDGGTSIREEEWQHTVSTSLPWRHPVVTPNWGERTFEHVAFVSLQVQAGVYPHSLHFLRSNKMQAGTSAQCCIS